MSAAVAATAHVDPIAGVESWKTVFIKAVEQQKAKEVTPFQSIVKNYGTVRLQLTESQTALSAAKKELSDTKATKDALSDELGKLKLAVKGVSVRSGREKELEDENASLNDQVRSALKQMQDFLETKQRFAELETAHKTVVAERDSLAERLSTCQKQLADRDNVVKLLKGEVGALQSENQIQRESFLAAKEENQRILPMIMEAKAKEAELMDQILALEQQLTEALKGTSSESPLSKTDRSRVFTDENITMANFSAAAKPSYIAHQTEGCHDGDILALTITESGRGIWTGGTDRVVKCWDATNGQPLSKIQTGASALCLDSNADSLVVGCSDATCRVYDLATLRARCQLTGHSEKVTASYLSGDASKVYTASSDRSLKSWDLSRGSLIATTLCHSATNDLSVCNDRIVSAHYDTTIRLWDARTGKSYAELPKAHVKTVTCVRFNKDGNKFVSLSRDNTIKQFDVRVMKDILTLTSPALSIASNVTRLTLSPDDCYCGVGTVSGTVLVWDLQPDSSAVQLKNGHKSSVPVVCWSPDARGLASAGSDKTLTFWR